MESHDEKARTLKELQEKIETLDKRLMHIEQLLMSPDRNVLISVPDTELDIEINVPKKPKGSIEIGLGEYGMAWLGNIVLLFGITFLSQTLYASGKILLATLVSYVSVLAIYLASYYAKKSYAYLSRLLLFNGHLLLYYFTLRLSFFNENIVLSDPVYVLLALILISVFLLYRAYHQKWQFHFGFVLVLMLATGVVSNNSHLMLGLTVFVSAVSVITYQKYNWVKLLVIMISLVYFLHINWLVNNPIITKVAEFRSTSDFGIVYLLLNASVFSVLAILPKKASNSDELILATLIWNGLGFTTALSLTIVVFYTTQYAFILAAVSLLCLVFSFILKYRSYLSITASLYAIYAFISLSVALYGIFLLPKAYTFLVLQSLLVVSMALWFRSRFMVLANTFLFVLILILFLKDEGTGSVSSFVFMIVAFISARIMNWKKERLNLKTELIRNLYLSSGWIMTLIAFHRVMPQSFITISWIGVALLFFLFSYYLRNIKYRWLAIATMIASAVNLVFRDMKNMEITFRILVFLALAIILITVSIVYTKWLKHRNELLSETEEKDAE
mgnify:CR=1 FL=1